MAVHRAVTKRRSAITRGKMYSHYADIDQRGAQPRRFRDLLEEFSNAAMLANKASLTESGKIMARRCAHLVVLCESMEQEYLEGKVANAIEYGREYVRASGTLNRLLKALGINFAHTSIRIGGGGESMEEYIKRTYGRRNGKEDD